jgi:hypothetical protein
MMADLKAGIKFKKHETIFASKDFIKLKVFLLLMNEMKGREEKSCSYEWQ